MDVHWGLVVGIVACVVCWVLIEKTTLGLRRAHRRRQRARRAGAGPAGRPADRRLHRARRGLRRARRHLRGRRRPGSGQRLAGRRLRLHRHPRRLPRAPQSAGHHPGRDPARRHRRLRRPDPAPHGPARRHGPGAAGHDLRGDPAVSETLYGRFKIFKPELLGERADGHGDLGLWGVPHRHPRRRHPRLDAVPLRRRSANASPSAPAASISASRARSSSAR